MHLVACLCTLQAPLIPQPREYAGLADIALRSGVEISPGPNAEDRFTIQDLSDGLRARGVRTGPAERWGWS